VAHSLVVNDDYLLLLFYCKLRYDLTACDYPEPVFTPAAKAKNASRI